MAAKKRKSEEVVAETADVVTEALPLPSEPEQPAILAFSATELTSMRLAELEAQVAQRDAQIAGMAKQLLLQQLDPKGLLAAEEAKGNNARREFEQARLRYRNALSAAAARLNIDPNKVSFDPDTGVIHTVL